jgi:competence protein ComEA
MRRFMCALAIACAWLLVTPVTAQEKAPAAKPAASAASPLNLNTATTAQIATLPGIGPKVAQRIVEHRQKNGGFKKIEELMNIKGIGEKSFLKLKALVTVADKPSAARQ